MSGLPFEKIWVAALKSVRAKGVFKRPLFLQESEVWDLDIEESIKLIATFFFVKNEAAFRRGGRNAGIILGNVDDNV